MNGKQTYDILTSCVHQLLAVNMNHPLTLYITNDYENNSHKIYIKNKRFNHSSELNQSILQKPIKQIYSF